MTRKVIRHIILFCLLSILAAIIALRVDTESSKAVPPEVNTEGLIQCEVIVTETPENITESTTTAELLFTEEDVVMIAKTLWGECRGLSEEEQAQVAWCILNRVDDKRFPNTISGVITQPYQFYGYSSSFPVWENLEDVARDVLTRWSYEKQGISVERELDPEYVYFTGNGYENIFRIGY